MFTVLCRIQYLWNYYHMVLKWYWILLKLWSCNFDWVLLISKDNILQLFYGTSYNCFVPFLTIVQSISLDFLSFFTIASLRMVTKFYLSTWALWLWLEIELLATFVCELSTLLMWDHTISLNLWLVFNLVCLRVWFF